MNNAKLKSMIAAVAPTLATALGGPLAGVAVKAIAGGLLGSDTATEAAVEEALAGATGADLVKLKEIEAQFKTDLKNAGVKLEEIAAHDRHSARERQVKMRDWTPSLLGLAIIGGFFGVLAFIFHYGLPIAGGEVLLTMTGALGAMTTQVCNYFFGSSQGSKDKAEQIAAMKGGA